MVEEKILIVDDNAEVIENTKHLLTEVGYGVTSCKSGKDALEFLKDNTVDLVLLDINMPEMDLFRKELPADDRCLPPYSPAPSAG